jgi:hypothetical protein
VRLVASWASSNRRRSCIRVTLPTRRTALAAVAHLSAYD